jgi:hypothetical protein
MRANGVSIPDAVRAVSSIDRREWKGGTTDESRSAEPLQPDYSWPGLRALRTGRIEKMSNTRGPSVR